MSKVIKEHYTQKNTVSISNQSTTSTSLILNHEMIIIYSIYH